MADLSAFNGQTVQVRFRLASDVLTAAEGWYIDDMQAVTNPFLVYNTGSYSMANGFITGSVTDEVLVLSTPVQSVETTTLPQVQQVAAAPNGLELTLSPNPATSVVNLQLLSTTQEPAQVRILNGRGQAMYVRTDLPMSGQENITVNVSDWPAGLYFTQLIQGDEQITQKLIIK